MEDGLTGGGIHFLGHLILQVLDDNLREGRLEGETEGEGRGKGRQKERREGVTNFL